ncbi:MAG: hypothetical protein IJP13_02610 [Lachnospiraceae bacterium]|nr:hypothetical protein [Lachnospiraceae bacterium]
MKIRIYDCKEVYRGIDRNFPKWGRAPRDVMDKYLKYNELMDLSEDDTENLNEFVEIYKYFSKICVNIEMVIISEQYIENDKYCYLGIDIGSDYDESVFSGTQYQRYNILNDMKLIQDEVTANAFIVNEKCNELGEKLQKYYVYKYII